ncbi:MAG TPA: hypothetical protein VGK67_23595 [Myxococcales bacterium]|jgi:hypothetical protein
MRAPPLLVSLAAALCLSAAATAAAADFVDPATGTRFDSEPTVDGTDYRCLGAGGPLAGGYSLAYCVEAEQAEAVDTLVKLVYPNRSGTTLERTLAGDQHFFDALTEVPGDKLVVLHLVRDTSQHSLAQAFGQALSGRLDKKKLERLQGLFAGGARGDTALIYTHGSRVTIDVGGVSKSLEDDEIAGKLWDTWLGPRSVSPGLKSSIAHAAAAEGLPESA